MQDMIETGQQQQVMPVTIARQFYKHACKTLAMCLAAFGLAGALAVGALYGPGGELDRSFVVVTFFAWGAFAAAAVLALRKPPF